MAKLDRDLAFSFADMRLLQEQGIKAMEVAHETAQIQEGCLTRLRGYLAELPAGVDTRDMEEQLDLCQGNIFTPEYEDTKNLLWNQIDRLIENVRRIDREGALELTEIGERLRQFLWLHANVIGLLGNGTRSLGAEDFSARLNQVLDWGETEGLSDYLLLVDGTVLYRWEAIGDALQQEHLTQAERAALLKVLQEMGYESEQRQEELYHDLVELLLESNGTVWGAVHLAELEQAFRQMGEQPPKGYQAFAAAIEAGLLRRYGDDLETYHALAERYGVLTAHSLFPIAELVGIQPDHLLADPMYAGLLNQLTGTAATNALSTEKILQLLEQHPPKRELAVALLEFLELEKDLNSFGLSVKDVFDQHSNPYRILGEEEYLRIYQEKHQLVRNIKFELDKVERMRDYLEQKRKEAGGSLVRDGKEWTRQDLAYYRMVQILSGRQPMGTKDQTMKGHLQGIQKRMLKDPDLLYDPEVRKSLDEARKIFNGMAQETFRKKVERATEYWELVKEYNEKEVFFLTLSTLDNFDLSTRKKLLAAMYDMEKNDGMMSDAFRQPCIEAGMTGWDIVFAITCWNSEMTVQELAIMSAGESFGRASSWMEQSMVEKAQSVMPLNKSSILNPTTYDPEYTTYPKLDSVKGTNVGKGTAGQDVGESLKLKDTNTGGVVSTEGQGEIINTSSAGFGELNPVSSLNKRQRELLELLDESGSTTILSKKSVSMNDLRQLTGVTGDEFNMFTKGNQRLIIRGQGNQIRVSPEMYDDLFNGVYGRFSGHTHPFGYSLEPGPADEPFLKLLGQNRSSVWGTEGDGWLPFGQEPWLTEDIRQEIRREIMTKLYGGQ